VFLTDLRLGCIFLSTAVSESAAFSAGVRRFGVKPADIRRGTATAGIPAARADAKMRMAPSETARPWRRRRRTVPPARSCRPRAGQAARRSLL